ncbi:PREDICTED: immunoglobulin-binding protein 1-like isoform X2 [Priapulus caudatus]|nr:PREDICTED: immunoglobulin-binding protein 1-like isoform X2 [Priapulus caudatus]
MLDWLIVSFPAYISTRKAQRVPLQTNRANLQNSISASMADIQSDNVKVLEIFDAAAKLQHAIERSDDPTNSREYQEKLKKCVHMLEDVTMMVSHLGVFSSNEAVEEVGTNDLRYFLLPALLGHLSLNLMGEDTNRSDILKVAEVYHRDFLRRCHDYGVTTVEAPEPSEDSEHRHPGRPDVAAMGRQRDEKIRRFREQKENEARLAELSSAVENQRVDDEVKREFYLLNIQKWIHNALEDLQSIIMEKQVLEHMTKRKAQGKGEEAEKRPPPKATFKPVIITKDKLQAAVFGAGYPSLPIYTVDEFIEQRYGNMEAASQA